MLLLSKDKSKTGTFIALWEVRTTRKDANHPNGFKSLPNWNISTKRYEVPDSDDCNYIDSDIAYNDYAFTDIEDGQLAIAYFKGNVLKVGKIIEDHSDEYEENKCQYK